MRKIKAQAVAMESRVWDAVALAVIFSAAVYALIIVAR